MGSADLQLPRRSALGASDPDLDPQTQWCAGPAPLRDAAGGRALVNVLRGCDVGALRVRSARYAGKQGSSFTAARVRSARGSGWPSGRAAWPWFDAGQHGALGAKCARLFTAWPDGLAAARPPAKAKRVEARAAPRRCWSSRVQRKAERVQGLAVGSVGRTESWLRTQQGRGFVPLLCSPVCARHRRAARAYASDRDAVRVRPWRSLVRTSKTTDLGRVASSGSLEEETRPRKGMEVESGLRSGPNFLIWYLSVLIRTLRRVGLDLDLVPHSKHGK